MKEFKCLIYIFPSKRREVAEWKNDTKWEVMGHSYSMFNGFSRCKMRYASKAIQHPCFLYSQSTSIFCFQISSFNMQHSCLSMQFWHSVCMLLCRVRYACYTIQYSSLDIELHARVTWPWDGRPLDKVCGLKIIARGVPVGCSTSSRWHSDGGQW